MSTQIILDEEASKILDKNYRYHYRYIIFKISDDLREIGVDRVRLMSELGTDSGSKERDREEYRLLGEILPQDSVRYVIYSYVNATGFWKRKLIVWYGPKTPFRMKLVCTDAVRVLQNKTKPDKTLEVKDADEFSKEP